MKKALLTLAILATLLCASCGGTKADGGATLDVAAAIDNPRPFDLAEIAGSVELIPLDGSNPAGLVGNVRGMAWTKDRFYITDNGREVLLKAFDRDGAFVSTLGRLGRGPDEFMGAPSLAADYDGGTLYVAAMGGNMRPVLVAYDGAGREMRRNDTVSGGDAIEFHDGKLITLMGSPASIDLGGDPNFRSSIGTRVPLLRVCSADMTPELTVETTDKGTGAIMIVDSDDNGAITGVSIMRGSTSVLASNGGSLLVKEPRSDTLRHYTDGRLETAWVLDFGKYKAPAEAFGLNPTVNAANSYGIRDVLESDRWLLADVNGIRNEDPRRLLFDKRDPAAGFSATGPDGKPGLFLDGVRVTPFAIRDNRLLGCIEALNLIDNAGGLARDDMKALAARTKEESNPILVIVELK